MTKPPLKKLFFLAAGCSFALNAMAETLDFISFSDIHINTVTERGQPRHIMEVNPSGPTDKEPVDKKNDLDTRTFSDFTSLIGNKFNSDMKDSKFIIMTGDLAGHTSVSENRAKFIKAGFENLNTQVGIPLGLPLLFIPGNNDSMVRDYGPYTNKTAQFAIDAGWNDAFLSRGASCAASANTWPCIVEENAGDNGGYFVARLAPDLLLIGLNSVPFGKDSATSHEGADAQLAWFDQKMKDIKPQERVLLGMHIGPGKEWIDTYHNKFNQTLAANQGKVIGILAGHSHMGNINGILVGKKGSKDEQLIPVINTPGLCTFYGNAPGFNHFTLSRQGADAPWSIKDFTTWSFIENGQLSLNKFYSFNTSYCPGKPDITLSECMKANINSRARINKPVVDVILDRLTAGNPHYKTDRGYPTIYKVDAP